MHRMTPCLVLLAICLASCGGGGDSPERLVERAREHHSFGEHDAAIALCDKAIEAKADFGPAYETKGKVLLSQEKAEEALAAYSAWATAAPEDAYGWFFKGRLELELAKANDALASGGKLVELAPDGAEGYALRGAATLLLGNESDAISDAKKCLDIDPKCVNGLLLRGELALIDYRFADAQKDADAAKKIEAKSVGAYLLRARALSALESHSFAEGAIDAAKEAGGTASLLYWRYGAEVAVHSGNFSRASTFIEGYEQRVGADNPVAALLRARMLHRQYKLNDALEAARKAGNAEGAGALRALILLDKGMSKEALEEANAAVTAKRSVEALLARCRVRMLSGDKAAAEDATAALQLRSHCADAIELRGMVRFMAGRLEDAYADFNKRQELRPESVLTLTARIDLRMRLKQGWNKSGFEGAYDTAKDRPATYPQPAHRHLDVARLHCVAVRNPAFADKKDEHIAKALEHVKKAKEAGLTLRAVYELDPMLEPLLENPAYVALWQ